MIINISYYCNKHHTGNARRSLRATHLAEIEPAVACFVVEESAVVAADLGTFAAVSRVDRVVLVLAIAQLEVRTAVKLSAPETDAIVEPS